ncbi:MAG: hypothetical protein UW41_C0009G0034 [Candidatus Collierbacteria bacterium GW2011_GWC2_44_18]|uniref:Gram-positive cocci surface proteins LPxTG domain-containing protein n=2 Tax=Microgenomates group TaxID=1794810 RepID=A0A0G1J4Y6_9BACT|nr:MAG: hypothetical protein UW41_C0009G0034 [Candidatus Collierbacteria bacterium GW2011_GWC2_44_18]KKT66398.1 MAG: hypothetical protein UW60_C0024G0002 [Candidatus Woesebacteria bacterium GW2011_GWA2_44_33]
MGLNRHIKSISKIASLVSAFLLVFTSFFTVFISPPQVIAYSNPAAVSLLTVANFAALAKSAITNPVAGTVLNNGDMGLDSPATCTGFPSPCTGVTTNGTINNGTIQYQNAVALQGQTDATAVVTNLNGRTADETIAGGVLDGLTLNAGVYNVPATATNLTGDLTLSGDASSIFIFRASSDLITASTARVLLTGGAQACNVYWTVASSATFDGATQFVGSVFAGASIDFTAGGATLTGRAIAQTAAITFRNTTVNNSSCASTSSTTTSGSGTGETTRADQALPPVTVCPTIIPGVITPSITDSRRVDANSIFLSWGPYSGTDRFNVRYGTTNGNWLYNVDVTGFSTTINNLPANTPIWVQVAVRNECQIGDYGAATLIGGAVGSGVIPRLPNTGFAPRENHTVLFLLAGLLLGTSAIFVFAHRKR